MFNINPNMIQQFMNFAQTFNGDPRARIQQMLNTGQVSQQQYNQAVQMAQQVQRMLPQFRPK